MINEDLLKKLPLITLLVLVLVTVFFGCACTITPLRANESLDSYNECQQYLWIKYKWQVNPEKFIDAPGCLGIATRDYFRLKDEGKQAVMIIQEVPYESEDHISCGEIEGNRIVSCEDCLPEPITFVFDEKNIWRVND